MIEKCITCTILYNKKYFMSSTLFKVKMNTIFGLIELIDGSIRAMFILVSQIELYIQDVM